MDRNIRGSVIKAYLKFIEKKWGREGLDQCLRDIGLQDDINEGAYYRDEYRENLLRWIERAKGPQYIVEAGKFVVRNLGILGWMLKFATPKTVADSFPKNFSEVYTFGSVKVDTSHRGRIVMRLTDVNRTDVSCQSWIGVCEGALEMTNTKGKVTKTRCCLTGDVYCEYVIEYNQ